MQLDIKTITEFMAILSVAGLIWLPIWWLLDILTPKKMLDQYFKEPHFNRGELIALNLFPASLMRTSIFGWTLWFPSLAKKRQLTNLAEGTPKWYRVALKTLTVGATLHGALIVVFFSRDIDISTICLVVYSLELLTKYAARL